MDRESAEGIISHLVTILGSRNGVRLIRFLVQKGATTQRELDEVLDIPRPTISRTLKYLVKVGIVAIKATIGPPYRPKKYPGPPIRVYMYVGAPPEAVVDAQVRYGAIILASNRSPDRGQSLKPISRAISEVLIANGVRVATKREIIEKCRKVPGLDPRDFKKVEKQVMIALRAHREAI